jgi:dienelactone hydrolase
VWRLLAAGEPLLAAAAPFYGPFPENADLSGSKAAVLAIYAGRGHMGDHHARRGQAALDAARLRHEIVTFPDVDHAFFNDTGARYSARAAPVARTPPSQPARSHTPESPNPVRLPHARLALLRVPSRRPDSRRRSSPP